MNKVYKWFLWIIGYTREEGDDDKLSHMLARQKQRMGWVWWVLSVGTLFILTSLLALLVWLAVHIIRFGINRVVRYLGGQYGCKKANK